jgi:hypothetical protein
MTNECCAFHFVNYLHERKRNSIVTKHAYIFMTQVRKIALGDQFKPKPCVTHYIYNILFRFYYYDF